MECEKKWNCWRKEFQIWEGSEQLGLHLWIMNNWTFGIAGFRKAKNQNFPSIAPFAFAKLNERNLTTRKSIKDNQIATTSILIKFFRRKRWQITQKFTVFHMHSGTKIIHFRNVPKNAWLWSVKFIMIYNFLFNYVFRTCFNAFFISSLCDINQNQVC